ncbi:MAG: gamma-glutamyl-gamma-aminobutyrate hydrolase family protein [Solirubrobacteraceae bacterium]
MSRPTVGVTASMEVMHSGAWVEETAGTPNAYVRAIQRAGGRAVILPPDPEAPVEVLEGLSALIVTGAAGDTDPARYGAVAHAQTHPLRAPREEFEFALVAAALDASLPLLGVCRGLQVLNVARGGTLVQHLPDVLGHSGHAETDGVYSEHRVRLAPGSLAARAVGAELATVKSFHHQGVGRVGDGLVASAWAQGDDIVEAIEDPDAPFVLGVLWHPEEDPASRVVAALLDAIRAPALGSAQEEWRPDL